MQSIFGTDGIRGIFDKDISYALVYKVGYALGLILKESNPIIIGRDTRVSGEILLEAISSGISAAGKEFINAGICPTPTIPFLIREKSFGSGIMISASHNPPKYNGIKIFDKYGEKISKDVENQIQLIIEESRAGKIISKKVPSSKTNKELLKMYTNSLLKTIGNGDLEGMKIVLDTCYGSATTCAEKVFKDLGANTIVINSEINGSKINLNCGSTCLAPLSKAILENEADMGFSFDGDADRVIGVDSKGNILDGDHILFLWGRELMEEKVLTKNTIVSTKMANLGLENAWKDLGGIFIRTEVGDKFIYEAITEKKAKLGGEQSGHILSKINNFCGDGILTAIQISKYCKQKKISLGSWLRSSFTPYPQKLTNIALDFDIKTRDKFFKELIDESIQKFSSTNSDYVRIYVRPSGTEPVLRILVEAINLKEVEFISKQITLELNSKIKRIMNY